jgi:hypothetical protein
MEVHSIRNPSDGLRLQTLAGTPDMVRARKKDKEVDVDTAIRTVPQCVSPEESGIHVCMCVLTVYLPTRRHVRYVHTSMYFPSPCFNLTYLPRVLCMWL